MSISSRFLALAVGWAIGGQAPGKGQLLRVAQCRAVHVLSAQVIVHLVTHIMHEIVCHLLKLFLAQTSHDAAAFNNSVASAVFTVNCSQFWQVFG